MKKLASAVIEARSDLGLTQEQFAEQAGVGLKTVQRIELAKVDPRGATLSALDRGASWPPGTARAILERGAQRPPSLPAAASSDQAGPTPRDDDKSAKEQLIEMSYRELGRVAELIEAAEGRKAAEAFMTNALRVRQETNALAHLGDTSLLHKEAR